MVSQSYYIHLPSNTSGEANKTSSFTVQLPKRLEFHAQWAVGLINIIYPHSWSTAAANAQQHIDIKWQNGMTTRIYVSSFPYSSVNELLFTLHKTLKKGQLCDVGIQAIENIPKRTKRGVAETDPRNKINDLNNELAKYRSDLVNKDREIRENTDVNRITRSLLPARKDILVKIAGVIALKKMELQKIYAYTTEKATQDQRESFNLLIQHYELELRYHRENLVEVNAKISKNNFDIANYQRKIDDVDARLKESVDKSTLEHQRSLLVAGKERIHKIKENNENTKKWLEATIIKNERDIESVNQKARDNPLLNRETFETQQSRDPEQRKKESETFHKFIEAADSAFELLNYASLVQAKKKKDEEALTEWYRKMLQADNLGILLLKDIDAENIGKAELERMDSVVEAIDILATLTNHASKERDRLESLAQHVRRIKEREHADRVAEARRIEAARGQPARSEPSRGQPARGEPVRGEPSRGEPEISENTCKLIESEEYKRLADYLVFNYDETSKKINASIDTRYISSIQISENLNYILGFELNQTLSEKFQIAKYEPDLKGGIHTLYIYAPGLIENTILGNKASPLLRITTVKGAPGDIVEDTFLAPQYYKLLEKQISQIRIEIRSNTGRLIDFNFGDCILTINFKKFPFL